MTSLRLSCEILATLTPVLVALLAPKDAVLKQLWRREPLRLWHFESAVVAAFLGAVVCVSAHYFPSPDPTLEWNGWAALMLAHGRNSVMFRMMETQARLAKQADPESVKALVSCWRWADLYFYGAELFWARYFYRHEAWSALAGVAVFVGYARWRKWYTKQQAAFAE